MLAVLLLRPPIKSHFTLNVCKMFLKFSFSRVEQPLKAWVFMQFMCCVESPGVVDINVCVESSQELIESV